MFYRVKALPHGKANVIQRDIILDVDKGLVAGLQSVNMPQGMKIVICCCRKFGHNNRCNGKSLAFKA